MTQPGMLIIRAKLCVACKRCRIECAVAHSEAKELVGAMSESPPSRPRIQVKPLGEWSAPYQCRHCEDPPCVPVCPSEALKKDDGALVVLDLEACTGAGKCVKRCPFLGVVMDPDGEHAVKCDLCVERLERGEMPACATACPTGAITYKSADELTDEERAYYGGTPGAALVRREGIAYSIDPDECIACRKCAAVCPAEAIKGAKKTPHEIILERCIQCGACYVNCPVDAVQVS